MHTRGIPPALYLLFALSKDNEQDAHEIYYDRGDWIPVGNYINLFTECGKSVVIEMKIAESGKMRKSKRF
jgi:hypothetical protein